MRDIRGDRYYEWGQELGKNPNELENWTPCSFMAKQIVNYIDIILQANGVDITKIKALELWPW